MTKPPAQAGRPGKVGLDDHLASLNSDIDLRTRMKANFLADVLWNHDLPFRADPVSHTASV